MNAATGSLLKRIYTDPSSPASFSGASAVYKEDRKHGLNVSLAEVRKFLQSSETFTKHAGSRKRFQRSGLIAYSIDYSWQTDLADVEKTWRQNLGIRFLLIVVDDLSSFLWVKPLRHKSATDVTTAMKQILDTGRRPKW